ncbi:MAG: hypothetical protein QOH49_3169 [Acidobacteriota bacterium]|jgi:flagellar motor protein MotB|nr:hypothetical protein [Acidobacteriota bacterium]
MGKESHFTGAGRPDADTDAALESLLHQLTVARATELARGGRYAEAESVLSEAGGGAESAPASLDLLARVRAQQGALAEAEKLWERASRFDPSNAAYRNALRRVVALRRRPARRLRTLPLAVCLSAVVLACAVWWLLTRSNTQVPPTTVQSVNAQVAATSRADEQASPAATVPTGAGAAPVVDIIVNIEGITQTKTSDGLRLEFKGGLFARGATLRRDGRRRLTVLGAQLKPYGDEVSVEIVGMTDAVPVPRASRYRDNVALGLERARVVYDYLRTTAGLGARMLKISSQGGQRASRPDGTPDDGASKRSVTLHITPQQRQNDRD